MSLPRFSVRNIVPVNLVMIAVLIAGCFAAITIRRQFFPEVKPDGAIVRLYLPGASPEQLEDNMAIKVEDALAGMREVDELRTNITEGMGTIEVTFHDEIEDIEKAVKDVERRLDRIQDLPDDAEDISVTEMQNQLPVIMLLTYGDVDEEVLKRTARNVRDDLRSLPRMGQVAMGGVRDYELSVEPDTSELIRHGISLPQVSNAVSRWLAEVPGGSLRSSGSTIGIRTLGVPEQAAAIRDIVVRAMPDGEVITVGDLATVSETFVDSPVRIRYGGKPAANLTVSKIGSQDIVLMARMVRAYVKGRLGENHGHSSFELMLNPTIKEAWELGYSQKDSLPPGVSLDTMTDLARFVEGRLALLSENAFYGAVLVFLTLLIFLNWRCAFWVGIGLVTAMCGTLIVMQVMEVTLNLLTMFGLIIVIGLLVDDAIVVAENIQAQKDLGLPAMEAAVTGARQVQWPVVATVLTSIVAFLPLMFLQGMVGDLMGALPIVVAIALAMSLLECLGMLPGHLGHALKAAPKTKKSTEGFHHWRDRLLYQRLVPAYRRILRAMLARRYLTLASATAILVMSLGFVAGGRVGYTFLPSDDAESVAVNIALPPGAGIGHTSRVTQVIEEVSGSQDEIKSMLSLVGISTSMESGAGMGFATNISQIFLELEPAENRELNAQAVLTRIRSELDGKVPGVERLTTSEMTGGPIMEDITIRITGDDHDRMMLLAEVIKEDLRRFEGLGEIGDDLDDGLREMHIELKPSAAPLGFSVSDVASQVRGMVYGIDAHVFSDEREDIDVRVRAAGGGDGDLASIEQMWLIGNTGTAVPLSEVAEVTDGSGYTGIKRVNRTRSMNVTAETADGLSPELVVASLPIDEWRKAFPDLSINFKGRQENQRDAFSSLPIGFMTSVLLIYLILAWLFSSYGLPLTVMAAIPFGLIGVVWGHFLMGYEMTFLSIIGFVALSGIVVNDSLILVDFYLAERRAGLSIHDALVSAGGKRLRPILLTTITTVLGLTPLMLEQSFQAKFLVPMAIAIAFGLMGATMLILLLLPCMIMILDDIRGASHFLWFGKRRTDKPSEKQDDSSPEPMSGTGAPAPS